MEHKPEVQEAQALHLLSPAISDISESSVATVVNSPSQFSQGFGCEPSGNYATQEKDNTTVHLLSDDAKIASGAHHTDSRDRSLHYASSPPKNGTSGRTWPLKTSRKSHTYPNIAVPDGLMKAQCETLEVGEDAIPPFDFVAQEVIQKGRKNLFSIAILIISLYSTIMSGLWVAIAALSPKLLPGAVGERTLYGDVWTSFANIDYINRECQTPITPKIDIDSSGPTCDAIQQAGQGAHGNASSDLRYRPRVPAMLYYNTTVKGSWVNLHNMTKLFNKHGRVVNNISLAFPHPGVATAARNARNKILQPAELGGQGQYRIQASVASPTINVLCAGLSDKDLEPILYSQWPGVAKSENHSMVWPDGTPSYPDWQNSTNFDDVFGFGEKYQRRSPIFEMKPPPYNSILNHSGLESDSIYVLATAADNSSMLCSMRATMPVDCSTIYEASATGGQLESHCEDPNDSNSYNRSVVDAPSGMVHPAWSAVGKEWGLAVALDGGQNGANASTPRLLTQFIPETSTLDPSMPSIAEALAALAGSTLLLSAQDTPFIHHWNYTNPIVPPVLQGFNATVKAYEYQSRYGQEW
ncbi:MAG: hypothetical protein Q9195_006363 [Heterodermia aff. obscurata]